VGVDVGVGAGVGVGVGVDYIKRLTGHHFIAHHHDPVLITYLAHARPVVLFLSGFWHASEGAHTLYLKGELGRVF
jgi:hypothetical protein